MATQQAFAASLYNKPLRQARSVTLPTAHAQDEVGLGDLPVALQVRLPHVHRGPENGADDALAHHLVQVDANDLGE